MKLPRNVNGSDFIKVLEKNFNYTIMHQVGSHVTLQTDIPSKQRITIPKHKSLRIGTLHSIIRSIAKHKEITKEEIIDFLN